MKHSNSAPLLASLLLHSSFILALGEAFAKPSSLIPMIKIPTLPFLRRRARVAAGSEPLALTLVSATYEPDYSAITLTFNQEIDTGVMDLSAFDVVDAQFTGQTFRGMSTVGLTADSVTVEMTVIGPASGTGVTLNVNAGNGIIAVSDGSEWSGVMGLALPFGA